MFLQKCFPILCKNFVKWLLTFHHVFHVFKVTASISTLHSAAMQGLPQSSLNDTMWCLYITVNFMQNTHIIYPIACLQGWFISNMFYTYSWIAAFNNLLCEIYYNSIWLYLYFVYFVETFIYTISFLRYYRCLINLNTKSRNVCYLFMQNTNQ